MIYFYHFSILIIAAHYFRWASLIFVIISSLIIENLFLSIAYHSSANGQAMAVVNMRQPTERVHSHDRNVCDVVHTQHVCGEGRAAKKEKPKTRAPKGLMRSFTTWKESRKKSLVNHCRDGKKTQRTYCSSIFIDLFSIRRLFRIIIETIRFYNRLTAKLMMILFLPLEIAILITLLHIFKTLKATKKT